MNAVCDKIACDKINVITIEEQHPCVWMRGYTLKQQIIKLSCYVLLFILNKQSNKQNCHASLMPSFIDSHSDIKISCSTAHRSYSMENFWNENFHLKKCKGITNSIWLSRSQIWRWKNRIYWNNLLQEGGNSSQANKENEHPGDQSFSCQFLKSTAKKQTKLCKTR